MRYHVACLALAAAVVVAAVLVRGAEGPATRPAPATEKGEVIEMAEPIVGTSANFEAEVIRSSTPVVVDFWASWCGPCRMVSPILDELAGEYEGKVKVVKVNVDEERALANQYRVQAIPTIIFFKDGAAADKVIGAESKASLAERFDKLAGGVG